MKLFESYHWINCEDVLYMDGHQNLRYHMKQVMKNKFKKKEKQIHQNTHGEKLVFSDLRCHSICTFMNMWITEKQESINTQKSVSEK